MSLSWTKRKTLLSSLLNSSDDDEESLALDRILHGQQVIGRTTKTAEIESLRFSDRDLVVLGTLEHGQFGVIDVVTCQLNGRVYVRKSIEKHFALRTHEQCSPQLERDILLCAKRERSSWAPHLLCAFQTSTHLNVVMDYAEGGTLWDVLESSPEGRVPEADILWWAPQAVCAINWCHSQGFVHRDIKPQNFVLTASNHMLLIDFGSAAPLSPPELDGSQSVPKRYTLVPCGTCDYISPEVLQAHEDALLALELSDDNASPSISKEATPYGLEVDWWSLGAMLYELVYGVAPFFAKDIRTTYLRILDYETSLRFNAAIPVSKQLQELLCGLLTDRRRRLGRCSVLEITEHPFFGNTDWSCVDSRPAPPDIHVPQFTYSVSAAPITPIERSDPTDEGNSQPFAFSALFHSSPNTSPGISILRDTSHHISPQAESAFIGFSWGPTEDAFLLPTDPFRKHERLATPRALQATSGKSSPYPSLKASSAATHFSAFATPVRPHSLSAFHTLPRTGTIRRTAQRRAVSDREAMKQLVECIGMSARKKVLASGRKPRLMQSFGRSFSNPVRKELRFGLQPIITNKTYDSDDFPAVVVASPSEGVDETESDGPPSPSPSPRPGSAMSILSRRSVTPTISRSYSARLLNLPSTSFTTSGSHEELLSNLQGDENVFESLENRHAAMMSDLTAIEGRLSCISMLLSVEAPRSSANVT
ncbi:kinase-like protein [Suillus clintonianus]|uniref:kinase-like protein n=1 Tax=Suillus clintonianus TaxID=1904413 RepID=UPI001B875EF4|nr:kinase-like protein [Suillus clintonianus]KAG2110136.1 kinase-like protein [Suillus clintonianus]